MVHKINFDDIRPFNDSEVNHYLRLLLHDEGFQRILQFLFKDQARIDQVKLLLAQVNTVKDLQLKFVYQLVDDLILKRSTDGLTSSGLEHLDRNTSYLYISNHRDIILDSAFINYLIVLEGMNTTEIAIGNNLLIEKWIEYAVKLNRTFVVRRNLPVRELLMASKKLSEYIRRDITQKNTSVWIAQREGRTKDGNDKTQQSLLKMLNLSNIKEFAEGFRELRIVPISISYEIEPCGISKVAELYKRQTEGFEKTQEDDLKSMGEGLVRPKGRVHFSFGEPITNQLTESDEPIPVQIEKLANYLDQQIYNNFELWPNNYIAEDILNHTSLNGEHYTPEQYNQFVSMMEEAVALIQGDSEIIRGMFLQMYVNPLINKRNIVKT
ncbi:MAG: 1-acyl-sn-glycerol-3-phosphate acyltransferase [Bacteroidota bacterium]|nr:glycerol acyltransferase [Odoribacter sp.]MDP3643121.1 1-acyl-sn-glycerol-3-phosphate acyltransferase [Bacteroidota bacterium]